jgi:hypothetical protein
LPHRERSLPRRRIARHYPTASTLYIPKVQSPHGLDLSPERLHERQRQHGQSPSSIRVMHMNATPANVHVAYAQSDALG